MFVSMMLNSNALRAIKYSSAKQTMIATATQMPIDGGPTLNNPHPELPG
jgi:hypothetical protein